MNILISNDDGIEADGIQCLAKALKNIANVTVAAPMYERSGASQSLTIHQPMQVKKVVRNGEFLGYGINGSPADCIKLALFDICKEKPDYIISGINKGPNNACNIHYSGTVGLNEAAVRKYIQDQEKEDILQDKLNVKEYHDPFKG